MNVIIAAAGKGTRMHPIGISTPKALIPILNKPLLLWDLDNLPAKDIDCVYVVISTDSLGDMIASFVESIRNKYPFRIETIIQKEQKGTADALQAASELVKGKFLFLNGDDLYGAQNLERLISSESFGLLTQEVTDPEKFGIAQTNTDGNLIKLIEKPKDFVGDLAYVGAVTLDDSVFEIIKNMPLSERGELELTDAINLFCEKKSVKCIKTIDYWIPIGYPWSILDATEKLIVNIENEITGTVEQGVSISGKVILPTSSIIRAGSHIEGNIVIGENTTIGPNAYVRGNVVIGNNCKVGFSSEVKTSVIMEGSKLPHFNYVGDSVVGKNVNFGAHAVVSNYRHDAKEIKSEVKGKLIGTGRNKFGSIIGDNVHLGIGTLIYPGRKIWPKAHTKPGLIVSRDLKSFTVNDYYSHLLIKTFPNSGIASVYISNEFKEIDSKEEIYFFDLDHTLIFTDNLKKVFNDNFADYNRNLFPKVWIDTYSQARTPEEYFIDKHISILKEKVLSEGEFLSSKDSWHIFEKSIEHHMEKILHKNMISQIESMDSSQGYVLITRGEIELQKNKVNQFLQYMDKKPMAIIYVYKTYKGPALRDLFELAPFAQLKSKKLYFVDDLVEELEHLHKYMPARSEYIHVFNELSDRSSQMLELAIPQSKSISINNFSKS